MGDDDTPRTFEELAEALYLAGYENSRRMLAEGMHPDAVRLWFHLADATHFTTWWGVEDALAGLPPSPVA